MRPSRILLSIALVGSLCLGAVPAAPARAQASDPRCGVTPLGAVAPAVPVWCLPQPLPGGASTFVQGANAWRDDWQHGLSNANLGAGYAQGVIGGGSAIHFRHNNHWMVDLRAQTGQYPTMVAAWMRPDRTFGKQTGRVVIEFEVAGPIAGTRGTALISNSWPELVLTTADRPTTAAENPWGSPWRQNGTYLYEAFPRHWAFGCRMQQSRHPICALYQPNAPGTPSYAGGPDRLWEINQNGTQVRSQSGGDPVVAGLADKWAVCAATDDADTVCRNQFRMELTNDEFWLYVRKPGASAYTLYYRAGLIDSNLGNILDAPGGFKVFFGDFAYQVTNDVVLRFHWDHLAVNPEALGSPPPPLGSPSSQPPAAAPAATATPTVQATSGTPTRTPAATPTRTPTATRTPTTPSGGAGGSGQTLAFDDLPGQSRALDGAQYGGLIDFGQGQWYLSGPYGALATKSISLVKGPTSGAFTLAPGRRLVSLVAYNGSTSGASTVTLTCAGRPDVTRSVPARQVVTIATGWTRGCSRGGPVTVAIDNGWVTNLDDLRLEG